MNTHTADNGARTELPTPAWCDQRVVQARRLFQRTLASWASDVLLIRHQRMAEPAWDEPARGPLTLIHPPNDPDGWSEAA